MTINIERARRDTPAAERLIHFNNAGTSLPPTPVTDAVIGYLRREAETGGYEAEIEAHEQLANFYTATSKLLNCEPDEIAYADSASRAWTAAFYAIPLKAGDRVLVSHSEYVTSYLALLQVSRRTGAKIEVIPNDELGRTNVAALRGLLDSDVKLIALTYVPTNGGLVNPAAEVGKVAKEAGILYLLDACQAVGQIPIDVQEIGCDFLTTPGRKYLRGPRGTGLLYARREVAERLEPLMLENGAADWVSRDDYRLHPAASRFEPHYELNFAGKIGLGVAIDYSLGWGLDAIRARVNMLAEYLRTQVGNLPVVTLRDMGGEKCGIVTFTVEGWQPEAIRAAMRQQAINVWVSIAANARLDMDERGLDKLCRASVHYYNTEAEVDRFCTVFEAMLRGT